MRLGNTKSVERVLRKVMMIRYIHTREIHGYKLAYIYFFGLNKQNMHQKREGDSISGGESPVKGAPRASRNGGASLCGRVLHLLHLNPRVADVRHRPHVFHTVLG